MAEALARRALPGVEVHSAGLHPGVEANPVAVEALREVGLDISKHRAQHVSAFLHLTFDAVYKMDTPDLNDYVKAKWMENWDVPDPAQGEIEQFRHVREMLIARIEGLRAQCQPAGSGMKVARAGHD